MAGSDTPVYLGESPGLNKCQGLGKEPLHSLDLPREPAAVPWAPITPREMSGPLWSLFIYLTLLKL